MTAVPADPPAIDHVPRLGHLRGRLLDRDLRAMIVSDVTNIRWLTGFTGSAGTLAVLPDRAVLVTDGRYRDRAEDELAAAGVECEVIAQGTPSSRHDAVVGLFAGLAAVGAEDDALSRRRWTEWSADLSLVAVSGVVEEGWRRKDPGEIARIEMAAACADAALAEVAPVLGERITEAEVAAELEYRMRLHGAHGASYATIVASGPDHAARPHHEPSNRMLVDGDTVVIDVGGLVDGYHSDMTRSFVVGEPTAEQAEVYDVLLSAQLAGLGSVGAGVEARHVDSVCREILTGAGYADWYLHSTGHGVGLDIHEEPFESPTSTSTLVAGDVVTVEPGLYRVGFGGVRIEDLVEVTEDGCRILTSSPKDTPCLPSPPTI